MLQISVNALKPQSSWNPMEEMGSIFLLYKAASTEPANIQTSAFLVDLYWKCSHT